MTAVGSTVAADNSLSLMASCLPPNQFGMVLTSRDQAFIPAASVGSNGNLCLGGSIGRFTAPSQIKSSGSSGRFSLAIDLTAIPQGAGTVAVVPGETWNFQAWYRDGGGAGSNFTTGLEVAFQ